MFLGTPPQFAPGPQAFPSPLAVPAAVPYPTIYFPGAPAPYPGMFAPPGAHRRSVARALPQIHCVVPFARGSCACVVSVSLVFQMTFALFACSPRLQPQARGGLREDPAHCLTLVRTLSSLPPRRRDADAARTGSRPTCCSARCRCSGARRSSGARCQRRPSRVGGERDARPRAHADRPHSEAGGAPPCPRPETPPEVVDCAVPCLLPAAASSLSLHGRRRGLAMPQQSAFLELAALRCALSLSLQQSSELFSLPPCAPASPRSCRLLFSSSIRTARGAT